MVAVLDSKIYNCYRSSLNISNSFYDRQNPSRSFDATSESLQILKI